MPTETVCPCCERTFGELDDMRWRAGMWVDKETGEEYPFICEYCHSNQHCRRKTSGS